MKSKIRQYLFELKYMKNNNTKESIAPVTVKEEIQMNTQRSIHTETFDNSCNDKGNETIYFENENEQPFNLSFDISEEEWSKKRKKTNLEKTSTDLKKQAVKTLKYQEDLEEKKFTIIVDDQKEFHQNTCTKKNTINLNSLEKKQWLINDVIDYTIQMKILKWKKDNEGKPDITGHIPSYYLQFLYYSTFETPIRYMYGKDLMEKDNLLVAINSQYENKNISGNVGNHWMLIDINFNDKELKLYNSMSNIKLSEHVKETLKTSYMQFICHECCFILDDYKLNYIIDTPRQPNEWDCGICVINNAECILNQTDLKRKENFVRRREEIRRELEA
ncbi:UNVERIFIED_CONTAM: hypothetical protein RMT77_018224 [Armadillidium vulgare]